MTIKQLTEIVNGSLTPSNKKLDASLVQISANSANKLSVAEDGLMVSVPDVDLSPYYTSTQTESAISAAIAQAQLAGGDVEVDLSGYATKAELESTTTLIDTKLNTALTDYSTTAEIATLLGSFEEGMGTQLAAKADKTDLEDYATLAMMGQFEDLVLGKFDTKVDKTELQTYQTEITNQLYTTSQEILARATIEDVEAMGNEFNAALLASKPSEVVVDSSDTPKINSVPLYTLNNNGEYVLCTPDSWLEINGMLIPAYKKTTVLGEV